MIHILDLLIFDWIERKVKPNYSIHTENLPTIFEDVLLSLNCNKNNKIYTYTFYNIEREHVHILQYWKRTCTHFTILKENMYTFYNIEREHVHILQYWKRTCTYFTILKENMYIFYNIEREHVHILQYWKRTCVSSWWEYIILHDASKEKD